ncbi:MAG: hypothetical protein MHM6MM_002561 [Cercozoa sp. M6MM]
MECRVLTYNVLSGFNATPGHCAVTNGRARFDVVEAYGANCGWPALSWKSRWPRLLQRIRDAEADVVLLQEMDRCTPLQAEGFHQAELLMPGARLCLPDGTWTRRIADVCSDDAQRDALLALESEFEGAGDTGGLSQDYGNVLLYRKSKFAPISAESLLAAGASAVEEVPLRELYACDDFGLRTTQEYKNKQGRGRRFDLPAMHICVTPEEVPWLKDTLTLELRLSVAANGCFSVRTRPHLPERVFEDDAALKERLMKKFSQVVVGALLRTSSLDGHLAVLTSHLVMVRGTGTVFQRANEFEAVLLRKLSQALRQHAKLDVRRVIVAGDFNAAPDEESHDSGEPSHAVSLMGAMTRVSCDASLFSNSKLRGQAVPESRQLTKHASAYNTEQLRQWLLRWPARDSYDPEQHRVELLDHIFVSGQIEISGDLQGPRALERRVSDLLPDISTEPSDHLPVYADLLDRTLQRAEEALQTTVDRAFLATDRENRDYFGPELSYLASFCTRAGASACANSQETPTKSMSKHKRITPVEWTPTNEWGRDKHAFEAGQTLFVVERYYKPLKVLGTGAYGVVVACEDLRNGHKVAIKKITRAFDDLIDAKRVLRELKLLRHLRGHENVIGMYDMLRPASRDEFEDVYMVLDFMETDMHRIIYSRNDLTNEHVQFFMYQLLRAIKFIHSAGVIHRDLKPSNLLLNSNCDLKVCDLGLARGVGHSEREVELTEYVVTRWYRAPEIMCSCQEYDRKIDVWSAGCIMAELLGRKPLFPGDNYINQLRLIFATLGTPSEEEMHWVSNDNALNYIRSLPPSPKKPWRTVFPNADPLAIDLLSRMLEFDPTRRCSVDEALNHPYLAALRAPDKESMTAPLFNFDFEARAKTDAGVRDLMYEEIMSFPRPDPLSHRPS